MKRLLLLLLTLSLLLLLGTLCTPAADYESEASAWTDITLRPLYIQHDMTLSSSINPGFKSDWPTFPVPEADGVAATSNFNMRGFAMSPDGRYSYMSMLHGGGDIVRGMFVMETMTGKITDYRTRYDGDVCNGADPHFSYPKGVDTDTRGYVYIGWTLSSSYNAAYLSVERQEADGTLSTLSEIPICLLGHAGDASGTKVGINGVAVAELDGRVFCYVATNYDHDALYRFDVTDPQKPVPDTSFGNNGVASASLSLSGSAVDELLYLDVDTDGTVYVAANFQSGKDGVAVLSQDGKACERVIALDGVYSVELAGNFLLCGMRSEGSVTVLTRSGRRVASLSTADDYGERITRLQIVHDVLFVSDAGSFAEQGNAIYAAPLSDLGETYLAAIIKGQNTGVGDFTPETNAPAESKSEPVTESAAASEAPSEAESPSAPDTSTAMAHTAPPHESDTTPTDGCASAVSAGALLCLLPCACLLRRKHM